jgi:hypothetical protein
MACHLLGGGQTLSVNGAGETITQRDSHFWKCDCNHFVSRRFDQGVEELSEAIELNPTQAWHLHIPSLVPCTDMAACPMMASIIARSRRV